MDHFRPRSGYQPCDTFFVEEDLRAQAEKQAKQEHDKLVNRERQYAMATQLSRLTSDEYRDDAVQQMMEMDSRTLPDVESIDIQSEIQWFMRPYLLDFLIEAHSAFQLLPSSLFLAINLLDRYCSKRVVYKRHYQLVGCAALLIAAKYNDKKDRVPTVKELKSMCCALYDDDMFIQMEWHVLQTLGWSVGHPTVDEFLSIALLDEPYDAEVEHMALYILEIALFHRDFVSKLSSELARAALALARCVLNRPQPRHNDWAAQYDSSTVVDLSLHIHQPSNVVARKYASSHFSRVAKIMEQFLSRQASLASYSRCTPPVESAVDSKPYMGEMGLATPQKPQQLSAVSRGYMTPPITPDTGAYSSQATSQELGHGATAPHGCLPSEVDTEMQYMATDAYHPQEAVYLPQQSHQVASYAPQGQMATEQTYSAIM